MTATLASRPLFWVAALAAVALLLVAFVVARPRAAASALTTVSVHDLHAAATAGARVLDVREPHEYAAGHVEGSILVSLATVAARASEFPKDETVYVFCRSGNRSLVAARALVDAGFTDVRNVDGGILAWDAARLPVAR